MTEIVNRPTETSEGMLKGFATFFLTLSIMSLLAGFIAASYESFVIGIACAASFLEGLLIYAVFTAGADILRLLRRILDQEHRPSAEGENALQTQEPLSIENRNELTSEGLQHLLKRNGIIQKIIDIRTKNSPVILEYDDWNFLVDNAVSEAVPHLIDHMSRMESANLEDHHYTVMRNHTEQLLLKAPEEVVLPLVYKYVVSEGAGVASLCQGIIRKRDMLHLGYVDDMLHSEVFDHRKKALELLQYEMNHYTSDDIAKIDSTIDTIKTGFVVRVEFIEEERKFSSKPKRTWICTCGRQNDAGKHTHCKACNSDIYGLKPQDIRPDEIIALLSKKAGVLKHHFDAD